MKDHLWVGIYLISLSPVISGDYTSCQQISCRGIMTVRFNAYFHINSFLSLLSSESKAELSSSGDTF